MPDGGSIVGVVRDHEGRPIAGANLVNQGRSTDQNREARTGADGRFRLDNLFEGSTGKEVLVRAKGQAPRRVKVEPGPRDRPSEVAIDLEAGHAIKGRVVDDKGKPIAGVMVDFADLTFGMILLHLFTFDPAWIRPRSAGAPAIVHFDGECAFCHGFVRFVLSEDATGAAFRFAPLATGDTLVVRIREGETLTRSTALLEVLARLGGFWRLMSVAARLVPRALRDALYDAFARVRRRLFARPEQSCPRIPEALRARFLDSQARAETLSLADWARLADA